MEDRLYEHLEWSVPPRPRAHEALGDQMTQAGLEMGLNTPYGESAALHLCWDSSKVVGIKCPGLCAGAALIKFGETQKQLGEAERKFVKSTNIHFLTPLRNFTEGEHRVIQVEPRNPAVLLVHSTINCLLFVNRMSRRCW